MIVIIGNGISGVTAAREIRKKSDEPILIISSETKYFFSRTALMYVYMGHMKFEHTQPYEAHFWEENNIDLLQTRIQSIDAVSKQLTDETGNKIPYDKLIIASGSKPNKFGWVGQDLQGVQGLYSKQDLELMEQNTQGISDAVIVGGGLIGVEMAEMLLTRNIRVHFLVRETHFWGNVLPVEDADFLMDHFRLHHGISFHFNTELDEIQGNDQGSVSGIMTRDGRQIMCQFVGLTVGVSPNIAFLEGSGIQTERGVLVNEFLETNIPDVYAIGDCAQHLHPPSGRPAVEQVWYTGKIMGETVAETICGEKKPYQPGNWFNSAKFFDVEYQTYGWVGNSLNNDQDDFIFRAGNTILLHFVFEKQSRRFIGVNTFGIRLRHELFNQWLNQNRTIEFVLENLKIANFDPEFSKNYEKDIIQAFNARYGTSIESVKKIWWQKLLSR